MFTNDVAFWERVKELRQNDIMAALDTSVTKGIENPQCNHDVIYGWPINYKC